METDDEEKHVGLTDRTITGRNRLCLKLVTVMVAGTQVATNREFAEVGTMTKLLAAEKLINNVTGF